MRKLSLVGVVSIALLLAGCKNDHEKAMSNMIDKVNEMTAVLKTVQDPASAKAAGPKLQAIATEMKQLGESAQKLPKPTAEQEKELKAKFEKEMTAAYTGFSTEMARIATNPTLMTPELQGAMSGMKGMK